MHFVLGKDVKINIGGLDMRMHTNYFTDKIVERTQEVFEGSKKKVYKIDDCHIVQELAKVDTGKTMEELHKTFRGKLPEYVKNRAEVITSDVPIMSYEMYLKELKDALIFNGEIQKGNISRFWVDGSEGMTVGNVLVLNKYPGKYTVISEIYNGGRMGEVFEMDLEELMKQLDKQ